MKVKTMIEVLEAAMQLGPEKRNEYMKAMKSELCKSATADEAATINKVFKKIGSVLANQKTLNEGKAMIAVSVGAKICEVLGQEIEDDVQGFTFTLFKNIAEVTEDFELVKA